MIGLISLVPLPTHKDFKMLFLRRAFNIEKSLIFLFFLPSGWAKWIYGCSYAFLLLIKFTIFLLIFHHLFVDIWDSENYMFKAFAHFTVEIWAPHNFEDAHISDNSSLLNNVCSLLQHISAHFCLDSFLHRTLKFL